MKKYAVILAGGTGSRARSAMPKQFVKLLGIPLLWWSVIQFRAEDDETQIILVIHPDWIEKWERLHARSNREEMKIDVAIVPGGKDRGESVRNALAYIDSQREDPQQTLVAVHDGARPLVDLSTISTSYKEAATRGAAIPVVPVTDSIRRLTGGGGSVPFDRSLLVAVQTPQTFRLDLLQKGYSHPDLPHFTDDASRVAHGATEVFLFEGDPENMKVTNPMDFTIAKALLRERQIRATEKEHNPE